MIYQIFIISSITLTAYCQYNSQTTTPAPQPPAQVHYVNIGADLAGDYKFGYDTGKGPLGQSFREETRAADGTVRGAYGYTDANGQQRIVKYSAGKEGFKIEDDSPAGGSAPRSAPAPTAAPYRPPQTQPPQIYRAPASSPQSYRSADNSYLELNARPVQPSVYRAPVQTLRQSIPQSYSAPSSYSSPSSYSPSSYSSNSLGSQGYNSQPSRPTYSSSSLSSNQGSSSGYPTYPQSQPTLQTYRAPAQSRPAPAQAYSQPALRSYGGLGTTARPEEETWGPPVINTALLSYNIGSQGGQPSSQLSYSSSSSSQSYQPYRAPDPASIPALSAPVLRSYSGLTSNKPVEEKWGPPVINTALLSYNIGSQHG